MRVPARCCYLPICLDDARPPLSAKCYALRSISLFYTSLSQWLRKKCVILGRWMTAPLLLCRKAITFLDILPLHSDCCWHWLTTHGACDEVRMLRLMSANCMKSMRVSTIALCMCTSLLVGTAKCHFLFRARYLGHLVPEYCSWTEWLIGTP